MCRAIVFSVLQFFQRLIYERWRLRWFQQPRPSRHVFAWNKKGNTFRYKQKLQYMIVFMRHFSNTDLGASVASSSSEYCEAQCWETDKRSYPDLIFESVTQYITEQKKNPEKIWWFVDLFHLLWEPIRWTPRFWERFYSPAYRHPGEKSIKIK